MRARKRWAPVECCTPLYDHYWFWNPENGSKRKSLARLLNSYVRSVGHGSVLLLNATPNTDGKVGGVSWSDDKFNQLVLDAAKETDVKKRVDMYAQAEQILVHDDAVIAPIYWYTRLSVTKPYITRTFSVLGGLEHYEKWDVAAH